MRTRSYLSRISANAYQAPRTTKFAEELKAEREEREAKGIEGPGPDPKVHAQIPDGDCWK